jgi:hypothetical protein
MEAQNQLDTFFKISFDENAREQLKTIALWAKITALCAFITYAVSLIVAIFGRTKTLSYNNQELTTETIKFWAIAGALIGAVLGYAINYFLYRFATDTRQALENIDQIKLNEGLRSLKTYFKILGILFFIVLIIFAGMFLIGVMGSAGRTY